MKPKYSCDKWQVKKDGHTMVLKDVVRDLECLQQKVDRLEREALLVRSESTGSVDYSQTTPETDQFMMSIDDSEIDLTLVRSQIHDLECQRNHYRSIAESQPNDRNETRETA